MIKLLFFILLICLFSSCRDNEKHEFSNLKCNGVCDSVHKFVHSDSEYGFYQMSSGRFEGDFVLYKDNDTIHGNITNFGSLKKTLYKYPNDKAKVRISFIDREKDNTSELIYFENGKINLSTSHFLKVYHRRDSILFYPNTPHIKADSVVFKIQDSIFQPQMKADTAYILISSEFNFENSYFIVLEKDSVNENSYKGLEFKLSNERINESSIFENI